ncbi:MAG: protease modulator HflC [Phycisphaerae bacterium]|nr:protease modulator HflC [Phycisphaerae bacterium]
MKKRIVAIAGLLLIVILGIVCMSSMYTIQEGKQAVITQFGKPVGEVTEAGLYFKVPFIQDVNRLEKRLLPWDGDPENMQTRDKKRIFIDVWARWRITDPMRFYQAVRTERRGYKILDDLVDASVRDVVASHNLIEVVRSSNRKLLYETEELEREAAEKHKSVETGREKMEEEILKSAGKELERGRYGMELTDVRIKRVNYIESVRNSVYERMQSERLRIAKLFESEAQEEKNRILGKMQKELEQITGEMQEKSAELRGNADAEVIEIAAKGFSQSPELFRFLRRIEAYKKSLGGGTRLILSTDNDFLRDMVETKKP